RQAITPIHPELREVLELILGSTFGMVVYQEQVMAIAQQLAGYTLASADLLRRAMGKKKKAELDRQFESFAAGMAASGFGREAMQSLWDVLVPFSSYGFNKSHTAGYGLLSYWTAYLKANYTADYMAALLTSVGDDKDRCALYLAECRRMGVRVLSPDVNESTLHFSAVDDAAIRFGLGAIRNVGESVVAAIIEGRHHGLYVSFSDFLGRVPQAGCNKRAIESLVKAGAFDSLKHPRRGLVAVHAQAVDMAVDAKKKASNGWASLFEDDEPVCTVDIPDLEWDLKTRLGFERDMLGLYVSEHPLNGAEATLTRHRTATIAEVLTAGQEDAQVTICGLITSVVRT
ncbi:DNA polymerase III subunit alpha, partial [Sphaerisporangium sp. NPDC049002]